MNAVNELAKPNYRISKAEILALLDVDMEAGRLFWRGPNKYRAQQCAGDEAGGFNGTPEGGIYWTVRIQGKLYRRSAIIFYLQHGRWPNSLADHIDGNTLNDKPKNLREATHTQNMWNRHQRRERTLPMGVRLIPKSGRYEARIVCNKRMHHLGAFNTPSEAHAVYLQKRQEFYGEFA